MRQVLIPRSRKAAPHPWKIRLDVARGAVPNTTVAVEDEQAAQQERMTYPTLRKGSRKRRFRTGQVPYRSASRTHRLRKNGRLRKDLT